MKYNKLSNITEQLGIRTLCWPRLIQRKRWTLYIFLTCFILIVYNLNRLSLDKLNTLFEEEYTPDKVDNLYSTFIIIDSHRLKQKDIKTWDAFTLQSLIRKELNLNSCLSLVCQINLIFYRDDTKFISTSTRSKLAAEIASLINGTYLGVNQPLRLLRRFYTNHVRIMEISSRNDDVLSLNEIIMEAYIKRYRYFHLILLTNRNTVASDEANNLVAKIRLLNVVSKYEIGSILEIDDQNGVVGIFFSQVHIDIFGFPFDPRIDYMSMAVKFPIFIYLEEFLTLSRSGQKFLQPDKVKVIQEITEDVRPLGKKDLKENQQMLTRFESVSTGCFSPFSTNGRMLIQYINATSSTECLRCVNQLQKSQQIISMSLYGDDPRYTMGALRNAQLFPIVFPGWRLRFYTSNQFWRFSLPPKDIRLKLEDLGAEIIILEGKEGALAPMLWRFTVAEETDVDVFVIRDSDSRLTSRDSIVVADWLRTNQSFHCIRDHPSHSNHPVSGGLWGARTKGLRRIFPEGLLKTMRSIGSGYVQDMGYLREVVWPRVKDKDAYCHDSFTCDTYEASHPFPVKRVGSEHLGQVYDKWSIGREDDVELLNAEPKNRACDPF